MENGTIPLPDLKSQQLITDVEKYLSLSLVPTLVPLTIAGSILVTVILTQSKLRTHSAALFLIAIFIMDSLFVTGEYLELFFKGLDSALTTSIAGCIIVNAIRQLGRYGGCFIMITVAMKRTFVLLKPKGCSALRQRAAALIILPVIVVMSLAISAPGLCSVLYEERIGRCWWSERRSKEMFYAARMILSCVAGLTIVMGTLFFAMLAILICKKRQQLKRDPINSNIASARLLDNQLSRINVITSIVCAQSILCSVAVLLSPILIYEAETDLSRRANLSSIIIIYLALVGVSMRLPILLAASPQIRTELLKLFKCQRRRNVRVAVASNKIRDPAVEESSAL